MAQEPRLTIVVPTRNRAPLLRQCLSYLTQSFPAAEIIVSDNASTDDTARVARDFRVRYERNGEDIGPYRNFVTAHRLATGDFVVYCADDDFLIPEPVARVVERMAADPELVAVHAPWGMTMPTRPDIGLAYHVEQDMPATFRNVVKNRVFPEIAVFRGDFARALPWPRPHIALPFVHLVASMAAGKVLIQPEPFYLVRIGISEQNGHKDAMTKWDEWRGGLEVLATTDPDLDMWSKLLMTAGYMRTHLEVAEQLNRAEGNTEIADALADRLRFYQ
jgi:glycosyltransferase involved in cell wall biosynthesis